MRLSHRVALLAVLSLSVAFTATASAAGSLGPDEDLLAAARKGSLAGVSAALAAGANVNARDSAQNTALILATANWDRIFPAQMDEIASLLISRGADVNAKNKYGGAALYWALDPSKASIARRLIEAGADVNSANLYGSRPLMGAGFGNFEIASLLIKNGADVEASDTAGTTPLLQAALMGNERYVDFLTANKANVNARDNRGWTPLLRTTDTLVARSLIAAGADVNYSRDSSATRLMTAAQKNDLPMARLLIAAGARIGLRDYLGIGPLLAAATEGHTEMVRLLLDKGANPNERFASGVTAIMWAARHNRVETVKLLIARGADVNAKTTRAGFSALREATSKGHLEVARILTAAGARP